MSFKLFSKLLTESYPKINMTSHFHALFMTFMIWPAVKSTLSIYNCSLENNTINKCWMYFRMRDSCFKGFLC